MRRQNDLPFAQLLNSVRYGMCNAEDIATLQTLAITSDHPDYSSQALHVFTTNQAVDTHNNAMLEATCTNIYTIDAITSRTDTQTGQAHTPVSYPASQSGGLMSTLTLTYSLGAWCKILPKSLGRR